MSTFYSQRLCDRLLNEFTGERCRLNHGHEGPCDSDPFGDKEQDE